MSDSALGVRDWDFVTMSDYRADMRESSEQAVAVIEHVRGREQAAKHRAACLELLLADALRQLGEGATASIYDDDLQKLPNTDQYVIFERHEYDRTFRARLPK